MNPTKFFKFVVSCKDSLTSIVLDIRQDDAQFCLAPEQILLHCQSLVKLHYISRVLQKHAAWTPSIAEFQHMRLIDLTLQLGCPSGTFDPSPFLKSAPNLRRLSLNGMEIDVRYSVVLSSLLCQHCPLLSSLHIAAEINEEMSLNDTAWQVQQMPGLIEFSMSDRFERFSGYVYSMKLL
ncbi:hypothetical protein BJV82DRAFT_674216 [Fennellomyces sp. T-0311]|nr:hypothetical protein BJV82DRAFT_674216 [Fennellomyces sp. T-0311]